MSLSIMRFSVVIALGLVLTAPVAAFANTPVGRTVTTVTAGEVAGQIVKQVKGVQLGSSGATITLDGKKSPVTVDFGALTKDLEEGRGGGLLALAAIPMVGGAFVNLLRFLSKLGR